MQKTSDSIIRREQALADLLCGLFNASGLRRWVATNWADVATELPGDIASQAHLAFAVADAMARRGLVTRTFVDLLIHERPDRKPYIERVAMLWGCGSPGTDVEADAKNAAGLSAGTAGSRAAADDVTGVADGSVGPGRSTPDARHAVLGIWVFGGVLLIFLGYIFLFAPGELPAYKQQLLGVFTALTAGLLAWFITGAKLLRIEHEARGDRSRRKLVLQATSGLVFFALVLLWWGSPLVPVAPKTEVIRETVIRSEIPEGVRPAPAAPPSREGARPPVDARRKRARGPDVQEGREDAQPPVDVAEPLAPAPHRTNAADPQLPLLIDELRHSEAQRRMSAASALGKMISASTDAKLREDVARMLAVVARDDESAEVRRSAITALTWIDGRSVYFHIGRMRAKDKAWKDLVRRTVEKTLTRHAPTFATTWPGGKPPSAEALLAAGTDAYYVYFSLVSLQTKADGATTEISCTVVIAIVNYPKGPVFVYKRGGARVSTGPSSRDIEDAKEDCVTGAVEHLIAWQVIPAFLLRRISGNSAPPPTR